MKRCICIMMTPILLLSGCTDIRERLLPDLLAADTGSPVRFAAHSSQDESVISAAAASAMMMPEALENASGKEISTGHLTMLAVGGNPCAVIEDYLQAQYLAPTCMVLCVPKSACSMLQNGTLPAPEEIQAAVKTGMLPCRTADAVIGDLWGCSGITALPCLQNGSLTLALRDRSRSFGTLSQDACRGLALFGSRWESFAFTADDVCYRLTDCRLFTEVRQTQTHLQITVSGEISAEPPLSEAAAGRLREMLNAAVTETALTQGADVLFLYETALRDGAADSSMTQELWRSALKRAACSIRVGGISEL